MITALANQTMERGNHQVGAKRLRQQQLGHRSSIVDSSISSSSSKRQRFGPCPVCKRSFALFRLEEHVNQCLDSPPSSAATPRSSSGSANPSSEQSPDAIVPAASSAVASASASFRPRPPLLPLCRQDGPSSVNGEVPRITSSAESPSLISGNCSTGAIVPATSSAVASAFSRPQPPLPLCRQDGPSSVNGEVPRIASVAESPSLIRGDCSTGAIVPATSSAVASASSRPQPQPRLPVCRQDGPSSVNGDVPRITSGAVSPGLARGSDGSPGAIIPANSSALASACSRPRPPLPLCRQDGSSSVTGDVPQITSVAESPSLIRGNCSTGVIVPAASSAVASASSRPQPPLPQDGPSSVNGDVSRITSVAGSPGLAQWSDRSSSAIVPAASSAVASASIRPQPPLLPLRRQDGSSSVTGDVPRITSGAVCPALVRGSGVRVEFGVAQSASLSPVCSGKLGKISELDGREANNVDCNSCRLVSSSASLAWVDEGVYSSGLQSPINTIHSRHKDASFSPTERSFGGDERAQLKCLSEFLGDDSGGGGSRGLSGEMMSRSMRDENGGGLDLEGMVEDMKDGNGRVMDRPPAGFKLFQRQVQSQARLSMFSKFSSSAPLERKPTVTVLQPGMVLFRSWLDLEIQQKLVQESQGVAHLFHRPTTSGGGKYHVYSMCWGPKWDSKAHRYVSRGPEQLLPPWMLELSQKLAQDAHYHTPVYPSDSTYTPDVGLVNFYPVKADELGVIGLGGHQDLDDSGLMPVVSISVGDSMTFFYRRLPPFSRRKSGVSISVDENAARSCEDGDVSHNREHQILLESGDVLVFGGQSRLVYHGTRHVQSGTRPPGLHMVPGRLNFTFRQTISKSA